MQSNAVSLSADLTQCDKEPIHKLGMIQSNAGLLALNAEWRIEVASENIDSFLGCSAQNLIGRSLAGLIDPKVFHTLRGALQRALVTQRSEPIFRCLLTKRAQLLDLSVHHNSDLIILELELAQSEEPGYDKLLSDMMALLRTAESIDELTDSVCQQFSAFFSYDRVMVYQFLPDDSGEVIAECLSGTMDSFKGLRFPASDIPKQARTLYIKNVFRMIRSVNDAPVALIPSQSGADTIDLSLAHLRSVSPVHIEYLKNMGVQSSLSVSIVIDGKLWGLIACHHSNEKNVSLRTRSEMILIGEVLALELQKRIGKMLRQANLLVEDAHHQISTSYPSEKPLSHFIEERSELLLGLIESDGVAMLIDGKVYASGVTPSEEAIKKLGDYFSTEEALVHAVEKINDLVEGNHFEKNVAGVLSVSISNDSKDFLFYFRKPQTTTVKWAGNPEKPVAVNEGSIRLSPRKSFEAWVESHSDACTPWSLEEIHIAEKLQITMLQVIVKYLDERNQILKDKNQQHQLLISELNHRVRNILHLVNSVVAQSVKPNQSVSDYSQSISSRILSLACSHDLLTAKQWSSVSFADILETELKSYLNTTSDLSISKNGPAVSIKPTAVTPIVLTLHEMLTNAVKYGPFSRSGSKGKLEIKWDKQQDDSMQLHWVESGGPKPVVTNEGFGMGLIRSVIPHELDGDVAIVTSDDGLEVTIIIPFKILEWEVSAQSSGKIKNIPVACQSKKKDWDKRLLVLEDTLLIAMDIRRSLNKLGFNKVDVLGDSDQALKYLEETTPSFAFLDFHLGSSNSLPVANKLADRAIPFSFLTGYGKELELPDRLKCVEILQKPCGVGELKQSLRSLSHTKKE